MSHVSFTADTSFMFKFVHGEVKPRVFRWTGRNQYVALCENNFISFGGG